MKTFLKWVFVRIPCIYVLGSVLVVLLLKWFPVTFTPLMAIRHFQNVRPETECVRHRWIPLDSVSPNMIKAVIASEDNLFFTHNGFDLDELRKMREEHEKKGKPIRGCSTISQQTAKNCFTFSTHTWWRKAFEAYYTVLIEKIWGKRRILEVYLNVAETGKGLYGVEAASVYYFGKPARSMTMSEAASLTCCLPSPLKRTPEWANRHMSCRCRQIVDLTRKLAYPDWI